MPAHSPRAVHTVAHPPAPVDSFGAYPQTPCTDADHSERKMIGILLPLTALGLMLQPRLNTRSTTPLSAPGTGTRAVVPLRMADGFVESVEDLETKIKEAAGKIKEAEGLAEDKVGDLEYKTKADICCSCSECRWACTAHVSATVCRTRGTLSKVLDAPPR